MDENNWSVLELLWFTLDQKYFEKTLFNLGMIKMSMIVIYCNYGKYILSSLIIWILLKRTFQLFCLPHNNLF